MVHTATLVHDDIIDGADTRRGRPSANTTWGNEKCVLAGDWLYMQAFEWRSKSATCACSICSSASPSRWSRASCCRFKSSARWSPRRVLRPHLPQDRLPVLKSPCVSARSWLAPPRPRKSLGAFGRAVGLAFQIVDDVLDLTATEEVLGKPVASDLREGKATLAVIHAADHGTASDRKAIRRVLDDRSFENVSRQQIREILVRNGSVEYAMAAADRYAEQSRQALAPLADSEFKRALLWVPDFVVAREK
jgi:octaprenyl-diphosphate synthase